jgi:DNA mismatch endonuclease, patch repair protein
MGSALFEALPGAAPAPSYKGLRAASDQASRAARGSSKKKDTRCEETLRRALWAAGCRYRKDVAGLPGRPDVVFSGPRVAIFCDGDFWHGRDWEVRRQKLGRGANSQYWLAKIQRNIERDRQNTRDLQDLGWTVLRFWESQIQTDLWAVTQIVLGTVRGRTLYPLLTGGGAKRKRGARTEGGQCAG